MRPRIVALALGALFVACSGASETDPTAAGESEPTAEPLRDDEESESPASATEEPRSPEGAAETDPDCDSAALRADLRNAERDELQRRLEVAQGCRLWDDFIYVTHELERRDERPAARARYEQTIGMIYLRELHDEDAAAAALTEALRLDPTLESVRRELDALAAED